VLNLISFLSFFIMVWYVIHKLYLCNQLLRLCSKSLTLFPPLTWDIFAGLEVLWSTVYISLCSLSDCLGNIFITFWYIIFVVIVYIITSVSRTKKDKIMWRACCSQYGMCWQLLLWQRINMQQWTTTQQWKRFLCGLFPGYITS
jgi:hypothetical protein